jgi:predicted nucleic acid-binding protein
MERPKPRPFLDTNVLFSGLYGSGPPATILERHAAGEIAIIISRQVLEELVRTIQLKHPLVLPMLGVFLMTTPPEICDDPSMEQVRTIERCINPTDAPILAAALSSQSDCVVSGNTRHFTPDAARCAGIRILTPAAFLAEFNT